VGKNRHTGEEIVAKLRQVDVLTARRWTVAEAIRQMGVTQVSCGMSSGRRHCSNNPSHLTTSPIQSICESEFWPPISKGKAAKWHRPQLSYIPGCGRQLDPPAPSGGVA
jgi:hypothetical protein